MSEKLTILVTGCEGQLGKEIRRASKDPRLSFGRFLFVDIDVLDICNRAEVQNYLKSHNVDVLVNCAAYTAVDKAESEVEEAFSVNRDGVAVLSECCAENGVYLIHISTDYVFDGNSVEPFKETDPPHPSSVYGMSKKAGEDAMVEKGVDGMIIRTAWLYSAFGKNFVKTMLRLGSEKPEVHVVADQRGAPTWAADLARAIIDVICKADFKARKGVEIYHYTNDGECTWYEFASAIMEMAGKTCKVIPISTAEYPAACKRPAYSVLDTSKIKRDFGLEIPLWDDSLRKMLEDLEKMGNANQII